MVRDGEVVGRGFHTYAQAKHAEIIALEEAGARRAAPRCTSRWNRARITGARRPAPMRWSRRAWRGVIAAMQDPNPQVAGEGFRRLRDAGVDVEIASEYPRRPRG